MKTQMVSQGRRLRRQRSRRIILMYVVSLLLFSSDMQWKFSLFQTALVWNNTVLVEIWNHNFIFMFSQEVATKSELDDKAVRVQEAEDGEVHSPLKDDESDDDSVRWGDYNY